MQTSYEKFVFPRKIRPSSECLSTVCEKLAILKEVVDDGVFLMVGSGSVYDCIE